MGDAIALSTELLVRSLKINMDEDSKECVREREGRGRGRGMIDCAFSCRVERASESLQRD